MREGRSAAQRLSDASSTASVVITTARHAATKTSKVAYDKWVMRGTRKSRFLPVANRSIQNLFN